ncbi:MFS transporter [Nonomuraea sp. SYSU D8015]|uniref:MFS transporter n=1 Tax=Nonomuraea sp. SYSU D8015 TaxID=2593644 RepID=UPI0016600824|nr:MFS transporter [Nonomuraea sp. SYSU D8015]
MIVEGVPLRRRLTVIGSLFLVSDIGYSFFFAALGTILLGKGVSLQDVALINLLGVIYFGRFLVGPVVDRYGVAGWGHYRSWLIGTQLALIVCLLALATLDPVADLPAVLSVTAAVLVVSAFHDTAVNGLSVRLLSAAERGVANGIQVGAASLSILIGSGGALLLYASAGWAVTLAAMAALFGVPLAVLARFTEPPSHRAPVSWRALAGPFRSRRTTAWILLVLPFLALGLYLATAVQPAMLLAAGWGMEDIALVQYTLAPLAGIAAGLATGTLITRWGRRRPVIVIGGWSALSLAGLLPLSTGTGHPAPAGTVVVAVAIAYSAMATWISTIAMDLARPASAATDVTVQISVLGVLRMLASAGGLTLAGIAGYPPLIGVSVLLSLAGTAVAAAWARRHSPAAPPNLATQKG